jgi:hypothetical protein
VFALHFPVSFGLIEKPTPLCLDILQNTPVISSQASVCCYPTSNGLMEKLAPSQSRKNTSEIGPSHTSVTESSKWSARPMYTSEKFLGISYESASEQEAQILFSEIKSRRKEHINSTLAKSSIKPSGGSSKGIRELNNLASSMNYDSSSKRSIPHSRVCGKASSPL